MSFSSRSKVNIVLSFVVLVSVIFSFYIFTKSTVHAQGTVTITEFPTSGSDSPLDITSGPDGNLWFSETMNNIGRITPTGSITEFPIPTANTNSWGITSGSDGNLWFTEQQANNIGRLTPSGTVTEFPIPTANSQPTAITSGPDGNLWFTEASGNKIGKITTNGTITEFPTPTANSNPNGITAGPDGNVWFTEFLNNIGRITPSGTITEFPIPSTTTNYPLGITTGPDGNLWFTEYNVNNIGRITPTGTVTEFPIPTATSFPYAITSGPDGNLWFTEFGGNNIGRITPSGTITEFPIPTASSHAYGITSGPDGNLWFTEAFNNIGRVNLSSPTPVETGSWQSPSSSGYVLDNDSVTLSAHAQSDLGVAYVQFDVQYQGMTSQTPACTGYLVSASSDLYSCTWTIGPVNSLILHPGPVTLYFTVWNNQGSSFEPAAPITGTLHTVTVRSTQGWAGYATAGNAFKIESYFTVEPVTCHAGNEQVANWVGAGGFNANLAQIGVDTKCFNTTPFTYSYLHVGVWETVGHGGTNGAQYILNHLVLDGNKMYASIVYAKGKYTLILKNLSRKWTFTKAVTIGSTATGDCIQEAPQVGTSNLDRAPMPDYGTFNMTCLVNGQAFTGANGLYRFIYQNSSNQTLSDTPLVTTGQTVTVVYKQSS
jgi:streptogramin lyase